MITKKEALEKIKEYVASQEEEVIQFLKDFIAIESVTYNEGKAVEFLANKMKEFGFDEVRIDKVGNVVGRVGSGKTVLLYDAHIDTVELGEPADWGGMNPLEAQMEEGKVLRGRGAVDDKGWPDRHHLRRQGPQGPGPGSGLHPVGVRLPVRGGRGGLLREGHDRGKPRHQARFRAGGRGLRGPRHPRP